MIRNIVTLIVLASPVLQTPIQQLVQTPTGHVATISHSNGFVKVQVKAATPLAATLAAIQKENSWTFNLEVAPLYSKFDTVDDTDPRWRVQHPGQAGVTAPAGGQFTTSFPEVGLSQSKDAMQSVLKQVVQDYNVSDNPGRYEVIEDPPGTIVVVGKQVKNDSGQLEDISPVLETRITIPKQDRTVYEAVTAILAEVSKLRGKQMLIGLVPNNDFLSSKTSVGGEDTARHLLVQALGDTGRPMHYTLGFDPDPVPQVFMLNVSVVMKTQVSGSDVKQVSPVERTP